MSQVQGSPSPPDRTARQLAAAIAAGELSATEALEAHLARVEERNGLLNAVVSLDAEGARRRAAELDAQLGAGRGRRERRGPLHGVPLTLKDGHAVAGLRTTVGTRELDGVASADGAVAARLRAAGANIIGHTNVAAWLADPLQSDNPVFGRTRNPWDPSRSPGGSSGGAAAAVAGGLSPLEIGSDLGGSLRIPAHFCGVYGLKPTEHRVPLTGFFPAPPGVPRAVRIMTSLGPLARDLADLELALRIISGPDGQDGDVPPVPLGDAPAVAIRGLRLAVATGFPGTVVSRSVSQAVRQVAARASDAGAAVEERLPEAPWAEAGGLFGDLAGAITTLFSPGAHLRDEQRSLSWYFGALERRDRITSCWVRFFEHHDALLLPPAATTAIGHGPTGDPVDLDGRPAPYWEVAAIPVMFNLTGLPALVLPAGVDDHGLPVGVQLVGPPWSELRLLAIAAALEAAGACPGWRAPPGP
jgi:amidase